MNCTINLLVGKFIESFTLDTEEKREKGKDLRKGGKDLRKGSVIMK